MSLALLAGYLLLGLIAGVFAGVFGIGGGIVLIPALVWLFHHTQHQAHGMSLAALLLPVGLLGALTYYRAHHFPIKPALLIALGLFCGAYLGAILAQQIPGKTLRVLFGVLTVLMGVRLIVGK